MEGNTLAALLLVFVLFVTSLSVVFIFYLKNLSRIQKPYRVPPASHKPETKEARYPKANGEVYVVTGGCGFLGSTIVRDLLRDERRKIRVLDVRSPQEEQRKSWPSRVTFQQVDLAEVAEEELSVLLRGADCVLHTAALLCYHQRLSFQWAAVEKANVKAVSRLLRVCQKEGVKALVVTSSFHVLFDGKAICGEGEEELEGRRVAAQKRAVSHYVKSKGLAEAMVLQAASSSLVTVALRPPGLYGYSPAGGDKFMLQMDHQRGFVQCTTADLALALQDFVAVDNISYAHVLAAEAALERRQGVNGAAFFITDDEPLEFHQFEEMRAKAFGWTRSPTPLLSGWLLELLAFTVETINWLSRGRFLAQGMISTLTPPSLLAMHVSYWVNIDKAKKVLGYFPIRSTEEWCNLYAKQFVSKTQ